MIIQIDQRTSKNGKPNQTQFKGSIHERNNYNFIYWLNLHLIREFGISIPDLAKDLDRIRDCSDYI
jgi:hypothetical protein